MTSLRELVVSVRATLPQPAVARWATLFFSLSVLTYVISLSVSEASLILALLCYAVENLRADSLRPVKGLHFPFPPVKLPVAVFCLLTVLSVFEAAEPGAGWPAVRKLVLFSIMLLAVALARAPALQEVLFGGLFFGSAVAGVVGTVQFVLEYRQVKAEHPGQIYLYMSTWRIHGFTRHWMNFGGQQMLVFCAGIAYLLLSETNPPHPASSVGGEGESKRTGKGKIAWALVSVIALSIVLNFTRGVWLGCFVAVVYLVARWKRRWLWLLPFLIGLGYLAAPSLARERLLSVLHPARDPSIAARLEMWQVGLRMIRAHPWLGVGPSNIEREYPLYLPAGKTPEVGYHGHLHNNFLQLGAASGLACLGAWVWMMAALAGHLVGTRRRLARRGESTWVADAALAGWLAFVAEGFFEFNFGTSPVLMLFLFLVSVPFAPTHEREPAPAVGV